MSDIVPGLNEIVETPEVSKEELTMAADVILSMVKTSKGLKMYLPNNPLVARFIEELTGKMGRHLALYGDFKLDIDQFELRYRGKAIYENRVPKESIAFKMYFDGIRYLIFSEGIEEHELCDFLDIIGKDRPGDIDDDIVTLLWEKNLPHLTYILAEDFLEFDTVGGTPAAPAARDAGALGCHCRRSTISDRRDTAGSIRTADGCGSGATGVNAPTVDRAERSASSAAWNGRRVASGGSQPGTWATIADRGATFVWFAAGSGSSKRWTVVPAIAVGGQCVTWSAALAWTFFCRRNRPVWRGRVA